MAEVTVNAFVKVSNAEKNDFVSYFKSLLNSMVNNQKDYDETKTIDGLNYLMKKLENYLEDCNNRQLSVAACHTRHFIQIIEEIQQKNK